MPGAPAPNGAASVVPLQAPGDASLFRLKAPCRFGVLPGLERPGKVASFPGTAPFLQHASRAIGHRDGAASSSASSWAPSVAPALFPNTPPRGEAFDRYQAPRQATFVSTLLLNYRRRSGLRPLSLARRPSARPMASKRRARRPGTEQSRLNVKLLRGVSGPGAAPLLPDPRMAPRQASCLLDRTRSPPLPAWRGAFLWFSAPAAKVAAGLPR